MMPRTFDLVALVGGMVLLYIVLVDAFETVVLPRRASGRFQLTRTFYSLSWAPWRAIGLRIRDRKRRETFLSLYGPLSLMLLIGIWVVLLTIAFALIRWGLIADPGSLPGSHLPLFTEEYVSGGAFVGLIDLRQRTTAARFLTICEAGAGFAFLALVIGYFPVLYQAFSRREASISLLDARAGSPPTALALLVRHGRHQAYAEFDSLLHEWEHWSAEVLESHISYPVLAFFRSQHDNQSWLAALTTILDATALTLAGIEGVSQFQAQLTFAMARHTIVDLAKLFDTPPRKDACERATPETMAALRARLAEGGIHAQDSAAAEQRLTELRQMYEPYLEGLARHLLMELPPWVPAKIAAHNWETSKWERLKSGETVLH